MANQITFNSKAIVTSNVFPKKEMQSILKQFRQDGFKVEKLDAGYQVSIISPKGKEFLVLRAMQGASGYLARYDERALSKG